MTNTAIPRRASAFRRYLLPAVAFNGVVIGGGYATGRELAEFFLPAGPWGGVGGILFAMALWSVVCALTFAFAVRVRATDYRTFFQALLGPAWPLFEATYLVFVVLILGVFAAAAGEIGAATLGLPLIAGAIAFAIVTVLVTALGEDAVEGLFKYATGFLYAVYAVFLVLSLTRLGDRIGGALAAVGGDGGWFESGLTYASYNAVAAIIVLPSLRHVERPREAVVAGLLAGPVAMLPALLFFLAMLAFTPAIADAPLPSDVILAQFGLTPFRYAFQVMVLLALLESGVGAVHAINERVAGWLRQRDGREFGAWARAGLAAFVLTACVFVASRFGLVALIGSGYRLLAYALIAVYLVPLVTLGVARLLRPPASDLQEMST